MRTPEQEARYAATRRAKIAAVALAEGRDPHRVGRPARLTPEQKLANAKIQNKRRTARSLARRTALRAERAIAEGRVPGEAGQPTPFTPEEQKANRRAWMKKHRLANLAAARLSAIARSHTRRARFRNADGKHNERDLTFLRFKQRDFCFFCGDTLGDETPHVDHFKPLAKGGSNDIGNLRLLHASCNIRKSTIFPHPADRAIQHSMLAW